MKNEFVANGELQLLHGQDKLSMKAMEKKYAKQLAAANPAQKAKIHEQMAQKFLRQKYHKPSFGTLW
jgi:hypothetical protein